MTNKISPKGNIVQFPIGKPSAKTNKLALKESSKTSVVDAASVFIDIKTKAKSFNQVLKLAESANKSLLELDKLEKVRDKLQQLIAQIKNSETANESLAPLRKTVIELEDSPLNEEAQLLRTYLPETSDKNLKVVPISDAINVPSAKAWLDKTDAEDLLASLEVVLHSVESKITSLQSERILMAEELPAVWSNRQTPELNPEDADRLAQQVSVEILNNPKTAKNAMELDFSMSELLKDPA
ncbi:MAG: hypothetical protein R3A13_10580 [Bdellovibrionota bacterium]